MQWAIVGNSYALPEFTQRLRCLLFADSNVIVPFSWEYVTVFSVQEAFVEQGYDSSVFFCADDASRCLHDLIHAGIYIRIVESVFAGIVKILLQELLLGTYHRKSRADYYCAYKLLVLQVYSLREYAPITQKPVTASPAPLSNAFRKFSRPSSFIDES